jgi:peptidoglycan/LPS O-acetylase OafA/YrhL
MRALAVVLVIAFHADMGRVQGGFIGVDVFFVLSGYLITRLLLTAAQTDGIRFVEFYARRMRRLLPAAITVLVVTGLAWVAMASAVEREPLLGDARSAALYFSNWHFAAQSTDYFASGDAPSPFEHFWSLSVEEQFYAVWPAIIAAVFLLCRRDPARARRWLAVVAVILLIGSLAALAMTTRQGDSALAYFGTHGRVYQLLAGGLLALWRHSRDEPVTRPVVRAAVSALQLLSLAGVVLVASSAVQLGPGLRGVWAVGLTVTLLWTVEADPRGAAAGPLSWSTVAYLGRISYGTYLWHWPLILIIRRFVVMAPHDLFLVASVLSFGLAALSHRVLEQPIRLSPGLAARSRSVLVGGLAASAVAGLLVLPLVLAAARVPTITARTDTGMPGAQSTSASAPAQAPPTTKTRVPGIDQIKAAGQKHTERTCLEHIARLGCLARRGTGPKVLVIGDSHLEAYFPVLEQLAERRDITLYTWMYYICPWHYDVLPTGENAEPCRNNKASLYGEVLPAIRPDVVIAINRGYDDPNYRRGLFRDGARGATDPGRVLGAAVDGAVDRITSAGARLIVIEPVPALTFHQRECLARAKFVEQCAGKAAGKLPSEKALEKRAAAKHDVVVVDLDKAVCPRLPVCDAVLKGVVVRQDYDHISVPFVRTLTDTLDRRLEAAGAYRHPPN